MLTWQKHLDTGGHAAQVGARLKAILPALPKPLEHTCFAGAMAAPTVLDLPSGTQDCPVCLGESQDAQPNPDVLPEPTAKRLKPS